MAAPAARNLADYYHWEHSGRGTQIYLNSGTAGALQAAVREAGPAEIGGILLGRTEAGKGGVIVIEDFVPVPCRNQGPSYVVAWPDTVRFEAALLRAALAACDSVAAPILGYFRSHHSDGLHLRPADLALIESYFKPPASVFLLVKPVLGGKACTAGFFFREDGRVCPDFSTLEAVLAPRAGRAEKAAFQPNATQFSH